MKLPIWQRLLGFKLTEVSKTTWYLRCPQWIPEQAFERSFEKTKPEAELVGMHVERAGRLLKVSIQ